MPDWFYRTLSRPALFRLPARRSRDIALGFMGRLASLPWGAGERIIDLLGHMRPDPRLRLSVFGQPVASPVGLGPRVDPAGRAARAWARFVFGWSGLVAYAAALGVHFAVGSVDFHHLLPAFAGFGLWIGGLALTFSWTHQNP